VKFANLLPCPDATHSADCATPELVYRVESIASVIHLSIPCPSPSLSELYAIVRTSPGATGFCKLT